MLNTILLRRQKQRGFLALPDDNVRTLKILDVPLELNVVRGYFLDLPLDFTQTHGIFEKFPKKYTCFFKTWLSKNSVVISRAETFTLFT